MDDLATADAENTTGRRTSFPGRLKSLIVVHLVLGIVAQAATSFVVQKAPPDPWLLVSLWSCDWIRTGQVWLLGFWIGMRFSRLWALLSAVFCGAAFFAAVQMAILGFQWLTSRAIGPNELAMVALIVIVRQVMKVGLLTTAFLLIRWKFAKLVRSADPSELDQAARWQFSVKQLLVLTLAAAVLLGIARFVSISGPVMFPITSFMSIYWTGALVSAACTVWATLAPGPVWGRVALALGVSVFLGLVTAMIYAEAGEAAQVMLASYLLPTTIVFVISLWVVLSCGYRLVPVKAAEA